MLWLWCRLAATALVRPLVWEPPYAMGATPKKTKRKKKKDLFADLGEGPFKTKKC